MIHASVLLTVLLRSVLIRFTEVLLSKSIVYVPYFSTREVSSLVVLLSARPTRKQGRENKQIYYYLGRTLLVLETKSTFFFAVFKSIPVKIESTQVDSHEIRTRQYMKVNTRLRFQTSLVLHCLGS